MPTKPTSHLAKFSTVKLLAFFTYHFFNIHRTHISFHPFILFSKQLPIVICKLVFHIRNFYRWLTSGNKPYFLTTSFNNSISSILIWLCVILLSLILFAILLILSSNVSMLFNFVFKIR